MTEAVFNYEGQLITIQCNKNDKMRDICSKLSIKINENINSLIFLYGGNKINLDKIFNEITKENKINVLAYKTENEICSKCGRILDNRIIEDILLLNNNTYYSLTGLISQIENMLKNNMNPNDINYINSQLKNINLVLNNVNDDIKKMKNQLEQIKINNNILKQNNFNEKNKLNESKNQIICVYKKDKDEINLLHDYKINLNDFIDEQKREWYIETKNEINEKNIDIYINDKKIKFDYQYKSNERGNIKVKFIFRNLLTTTYYMLCHCSSLISIDLSSFITTNVNNMGCMFLECSSLKSIDLSSFITTNVNNMRYMFEGCSSLESIDLSSFNTNNVKDMSGMFFGCSSLKKENVKFNNSDKKLLNEINNLKK